MTRAALITVMCVALVGCQVSTAPQDVARLDRGHGVSMLRAPWNGQYTLYLLPADRKGQRTVIQAAHLKKNEPLGFRERDAGPVAVAGDLEVALQPGEYQWVMQPDPGQVNWVGTVLLAAVVVTATLVIVYVIAAEEALNHYFSQSRSRP